MFAPELMSVQNAVEFSAPPVFPDVSQRSGKPRSCEYSCAKTPRPPFSGWMV
jgi:hypothetical protein